MPGPTPEALATERTLDRLVAREVGHNASTLVYELNQQRVAAASLGIVDALAELTSRDSWQDAFDDAGYLITHNSQADYYAVTHDQLREADSYPLAGSRDRYLDDHATPIDADDGELDNWQEACCAVDICDPHTREALEHWIVSDWFAARLAERGEITGELIGLTIWGRTCSGQAISLDGVVREIAQSMEILPGQRHAWETVEPTTDPADPTGPPCRWVVVRAEELSAISWRRAYVTASCEADAVASIDADAEPYHESDIEPSGRVAWAAAPIDGDETGEELHAAESSAIDRLLGDV
ncbi:MAG: hypothetical protein AAF805_00040 [Planctomycetota bacterium]